MILEKCTLCPNNCGVNRLKNEKGKCNITNNIKVSLSSLHYYEEPCISGKNGSGTIFFSNCNLKCIYCQNYKISQQGLGKNINIQELANLFLQQQKDGAHNVNLVTPTPYVIQIIEAIKIARKKGFNIPIIYNCGGYENIKTLKMLEGYIDVYLPDFKYADNELGVKYSNVNNYFDNVTVAIKEMYRQVGTPKLDENGIIQKGLIIRHLILPNHKNNTKNVLKWIEENIDNNVYVSIMAQYFPTNKAKENKFLNRKLNKKEYKEIEKYVATLNLTNGYIQELGEHEEEYVPDFK